MSGIMMLLLARVVGGGGYNEIKIFNSSGSWTAPTGVTEVEYLVVAGGAGGGANIGGGGGAGGFRTGTGFSVTAGTDYTVTIGGGGAGGAAGGNNAGVAGSNSVFSSITSGGGGTGAAAGGAAHWGAEPRPKPPRNSGRYSPGAPPCRQEGGGQSQTVGVI